MIWRPWGTALVRRVLEEHRAAVIALGVALLLNVLVYALLVYPLAQRVSNVAERTASAETELAAARTLNARAAGTLTGKARAAEDLDAFYNKVLPPNLASARRLVYPRLDQLARQANLRPVNAKATPDDDRSVTLYRLRINMELAGTYASARQFIDRLERVSEFVVVDHVDLSEAADADQLHIKLELSTYYRDGGE